MTTHREFLDALSPGDVVGVTHRGGKYKTRVTRRTKARIFARVNAERREESFNATTGNEVGSGFESGWGRPSLCRWTEEGARKAKLAAARTRIASANWPKVPPPVVLAIAEMLRDADGKNVAKVSFSLEVEP